MKILFNTMSLGKGGAERVINILSNEFIKDNEVMIVTNINTSVDYKFDEKIIIKSLMNSKYKTDFFHKLLNRISIKKIIKLKKIILGYNPDVVISFLPEPSFRILTLKKFCKKLRKIPVIVSVRNDPNTEYKNYIFRFIMKNLYPYSDELVLQTQDSKEYFERNIKYSGVVIPNPVESVFLIDRYEGTREKRIVAVGRLEAQKNYEMMVDAFEIFSRKNPEYILEIYGKGKLKAKIENYINIKNLQSKIILNGQVDNIVERIYKSSAFVMTSKYEGMPNSLLEAFCLGVPCISTDCPCGGPREIIDNGINGFIVQLDNPKQMADTMEKLVRDEERMNIFSENAKKKSELYAKSTILEKWKKVVNDTKHEKAR